MLVFCAVHIYAGTWMRVDSAEDNQQVVQDSIALARIEGLEGHARAAEIRKL